MTTIGGVTGGAIGGGANYVFQDGNQPKDWIDVTIAAITGYFGFGRGLGANVTINTSGAAIGSYIKGEDPYPGMAGAAIGTLIGFKVGQNIETQLGRVLNPWYRNDWIQGSLAMSRWNTPSAWPSILGNTGSSVTQETSGNAIRDSIFGRGK